MPDWKRYVRQNLKRGNADAVEEIARQLEDAYLEAVKSGLSGEEAETEAKLHITNWSALEESRRRMNFGDWLESLIRDGHYASRRLCRSFGFTFVAVLTLGLGIGANTVIFSAINSLLLNPAGIADASRILAFGVHYQKINVKSVSVSPAEFIDVRDSKETFSAAAIGATGSYNYAAADFPERLVGLRVTSQWFDVFGAKPILGRVFTAEEDEPNVNRVIVLDYATWRRLFGADPSVIERTIELNRQPYKIIGVMGPEFRRRDVNLWTPLGLPPALLNLQSRFNESYELVARVKPGISIEQAMAHIRVLTDRVHQQTDAKGQYARNNAWSIYARSYTEAVAGDLKSPMLVLMGAVGFVLLIACANVAGLMIARAAGHSRELAVRMALGAGRWRLIRQALAESGLVAVGGMALGLLIAYAGIRLLLMFAPPNLGGVSIELDFRVLGFTALIAVAAGLVFGLIPALQITGRENIESLKEGGRSGTASRGQLRFRSALVTLEIALAMILLLDAGLFLRSLSNLEQVDTGFESKGVMTGMVALPPPVYREADKQRTFHRALLDALRNTAGVSHASIGTPIPFAGDAGAAFVIEDRAVQPGEPAAQGRLRAVSSDYFATLQIPLLSGRVFTEQDTATSEPVVVIDENLARQYWPNQDPIGKRIRRTINNAQWTTIIGIVRHVKHSELAVDNGKGVHYYPVAQTPQVLTFAILAKTTLDPAGISGAIREAVRAADPAQPVFDLRTMEERILDSLGSRRFAVQLMILFAVVAIFMAAIGLYGVINYVVTQRTHEIGIRMALGAHRNQILGLVVRHGMGLTSIGIVVGSAGAVMLARLLSTQLFGVGPFDPEMFAVMAAAVGGVTLLACVIPAKRATAVDPLDACRFE